MRKALALGTAAASLTAVGLAGPASAACALGDLACGTTTVALTPATGTLTLVVTPVAVATPVTSTFSGTSNVQTLSLGPSTVTDTRLTSTGWTATLSTTDLSPVTGTAIPASAASFYVPDAPTQVLGTHSFTRAGTAGAAVASGLSPLSSSVSGINTAIFTPYMKVTIPSGTSVVAYTGTVTQSVA